MKKKVYLKNLTALPPVSKNEAVQVAPPCQHPIIFQTIFFGKENNQCGLNDISIFVHDENKEILHLTKPPFLFSRSVVFHLSLEK